MKVTVVGCKGFGKIHLDALKDLDVELDIVERDKDTIDFVTSHYNVNEIHSTLEEALRSDTDVMDLVIPHNIHREFAIKSMRAGKHVLLEKPIATNLVDADEIIKASVEYKRKFMVAEQFFFDPSLKIIKEKIRTGAIGNVHTMIVRSQGLNVKRRTEWRNRASLMGGGALIDGGIHLIDFMLNLGGDYDEIKSYCYPSTNSLEAEDTTMALFRFRSGVRGLFFYTWNYPQEVRLPTYEIIGDRGMIIEDTVKGTPMDSSDNNSKRVLGDPIVNGTKEIVDRFDVYRTEIKEFLESVSENKEVPYDPALQLRDLSTVLKIYENNDS